LRGFSFLLGGDPLCDYVIWAIPEDKRLRVGALRADFSPLPFGAEIIARVADVDLDMMLRWTKRRAKQGWPLEKIRAAC
jgi:hypothetical protein